MAGIALQELEGKDVENGGVTEEELFFFCFIHVLLNSRASAEKAGRGFDSREIVFEQWGGGCRKHWETFIEAREFWYISYAVEAVELILKMVIAELIADKKHDQETAGHTNG